MATKNKLVELEDNKLNFQNDLRNSISSEIRQLRGVRMEVWIQQDFKPVAQTDDGEDLYGYMCICPQNSQEESDLLHFLEDHGIPIDYDA